MACVRENSPVSRGLAADHGRTTSIVEYQPSSSMATSVPTRPATAPSTSSGPRVAPSALVEVPVLPDAAVGFWTVTEPIVPATQRALRPRPPHDPEGAPTVSARA